MAKLKILQYNNMPSYKILNHPIFPDNPKNNEILEINFYFFVDLFDEKSENK